MSNVNAYATMRAAYHVAASAGVSLGLQAAVHSWPATLGCFLSGVLIDIDHYLEYYLIRKKFPYRYKDLVDFCNYDRGDKVYLYFHAYEYLIVLWLSIYFFHLGLIWTGMTLGLTVHLMLDQFTNPIKPLFYFLTFRIINQFERTKTLSEAYFQRKRSAL
jgi:hypothetical protein